jgi:MFS family permease
MGMPLSDRLVAAGLALAAFLVYNANGREIGSYDSQPAKFLAIELARHHTLSLDGVIARLPPLAERPGFRRDRSGVYRCAYPLPSAMNAAAVASALALIHAVDLNGPAAPNLVAKLTASALTAAAVAMAFALTRRRVGTAAAMWIAIGFGFGTGLWSSVSQTLWQQETSTAALVAAVLVLSSKDASLRRSLVFGLLVGYAGWARPQVAPLVAGLLALAAVRWRARAVGALIACAGLTAIAVAINVRWFGHVLGAAPAFEALHPAVHAVSGSLGRHPVVAAAGLLVSPSRGVFIFSPIVAVAIAGLFETDPEHAWTDRALAAVVAVQIAAYASYSVWWGGHTFGPRYMLDVLPLLLPLAASGVRWLARRPIARVAAAACLAWSVAVAGLGAFVYPADRWNTSPADVDRFHARLWDWRDTQLRRAASAGTSPQNFDFFVN